MERITLSNLHDQLDSIRSTSIPQVKRYFRKRIVKCINECKTQAFNMKKSIESTSGSHSQQNEQQPNDYEFGWGSDFDEDDEDDEVQSAEVQQANNTTCDSKSQHTHLVQSLNCLHLKERPPARVQLAHSVSLQSFSSIETPSHPSAKGSSKSSPSNSSCRRPISEPPPPPLPTTLPPRIEEEEVAVCHRSGPMKSGISEDAYEVMSASTDNCDDEYLLPNSCLKSPEDTYLSAGSQENGNYEYIQYSQMDHYRPTSSSDSGSLFSSNSRSNLKDVDAFSERPLPPIPKEESVEDLMLTSYSWFHDLERNEAERMLKQIGRDGVYLVRRSKRAGLSSPFTLTLYHNERIFHLNVRHRTDGLYALGMEKYKEKTFASVAELVEHHNSEPIFLTSKGMPSGKTRLIFTPTSSQFHMRS